MRSRTARTSRSRRLLRRRASPSITTTRRTGSPRTSAPSSRPCPAASRARSAAAATGIRAASAPGCRTSTTRLSTASAPAPFPPAPTSAKVALNGSWDVNYGQGGVQNGPNIAFTVPASGMEVTFQWNSIDQGLAGHRRRHPRRPHQGAGVLALGRHHRLERAHRYRRHAVRGSGWRAHARWPRHRRRGELQILDAHARSGGPLRRRCARNFRTSRTSRRSSCPRTRSRPPRRA